MSSPCCVTYKLKSYLMFLIICLHHHVVKTKQICICFILWTEFSEYWVLRKCGFSLYLFLLFWKIHNV